MAASSEARYKLPSQFLGRLQKGTGVCVCGGGGGGGGAGGGVFKKGLTLTLAVPRTSSETDRSSFTDILWFVTFFVQLCWELKTYKQNRAIFLHRCHHPIICTIAIKDSDPMKKRQNNIYHGAHVLGQQLACLVGISTKASIFLHLWPPGTRAC